MHADTAVHTPGKKYPLSLDKAHARKTGGVPQHTMENLSDAVADAVLAEAETLKEALAAAQSTPDPEPEPEPAEPAAANAAIIDATADVVYRAFQMWRAQERKTSLAGAIEAALQATVQKKRLERKRRRLAFERKLAEALRARRVRDREDQQRAVTLLMSKRAKVVRGLPAIGASTNAGPGAGPGTGAKPPTRAEKKRAQLEAKLEQEREIAEATQSYEGARAALKATTAAQRAAAELAKTRSRTETLRAVADITASARADGSDGALLAGIEQLQALPFVDKAAQALVLKNIDVLQSQVAATATAAQQTAAAQHKTRLDAAALTAAHERRQRKRDVKLAFQQRDAERAVAEARDESARNAEATALVDRAAALAGTTDFRTEGQRLLTAALEHANGTSSEAAGLRRLILGMMATARKSGVKDAQRAIADARARFLLETPRVSDAFRAQLAGVIHDFTEDATADGRARARDALVQLRDVALSQGDVEPRVVAEISDTIKTLDAGELAVAKAALRHVDRAARRRAAVPPPPTAAQQDAEKWLRDLQATLLSEKVYTWSVDDLREAQREIRSMCADHDIDLPVALLRSIDQRVKGLSDIRNRAIGGQLKIDTKARMEQQQRQLRRLQDSAAAAKFDRDASAAGAVHYANEYIVSFLETAPTDRDIAETMEKMRKFLRDNDVKEQDIIATVRPLVDTVKSRTKGLKGRAQLAAKDEAGLQAQHLRWLQGEAAAANFQRELTALDAQYHANVQLTNFLATAHTGDEVRAKMNEVGGYLRTHGVLEKDIVMTLKPLEKTLKTHVKGLKGHLSIQNASDANAQAEVVKRKKDALVRQRGAGAVDGQGDVDMDGDDDDAEDDDDIGVPGFARGGVAGAAAAPQTDLFVKINAFRRKQQIRNGKPAEDDEEAHARRAQVELLEGQAAFKNLQKQVISVAEKAADLNPRQLELEIRHVILFANSSKTALSQAQTEFLQQIWDAKQKTQTEKVRTLAKEFIASGQAQSAAASQAELERLQGQLKCTNCKQAVCIVIKGPRKGTRVYFDGYKQELEFDGKRARKFALNRKEEKFALCADEGAQGRQVISLLGPSGVGKSTAIREFLEDYKKVFPENAIIMFSQKDTDLSIDPYVPDIIHVPLTTAIASYNKPERFRNTCVVFDDIEGLGADKEEKKIAQALLMFKNSVLTVGRSFGITVVISSHVATAGVSTKSQIGETIQTVIYPGNSGYKTLLTTYFEFNTRLLEYINTNQFETNMLCFDTRRHVLFTDNYVQFTSDWKQDVLRVPF